MRIHGNSEVYKKIPYRVHVGGMLRIQEVSDPEKVRRPLKRSSFCITKVRLDIGKYPETRQQTHHSIRHTLELFTALASIGNSRLKPNMVKFIISNGAKFLAKKVSNILLSKIISSRFFSQFGRQM